MLPVLVLLPVILVSAAPNIPIVGPKDFSSVIASSAGGCLNGMKIAELGCYRYKECMGGVWVTKDCPISQLFGDGKCRLFSEVDCTEKVCAPGSVSVYPQDCQKYLQCDETHHQVVKDCPTSYVPELYRYVFDPEKLECARAWGWIKCTTIQNFKSEERAIRTIREVQTNPDDCIDSDTKYDNIPGVCSTYMFCDNGKWARRACTKGEYYDDDKKTCTKTPCQYEGIPGDCESFTTADGKIEKCIFGMKFDKTTKECVDFAIGNCTDIECVGFERKNHPTNCALYLQCKNQQWKIKNCGWFRNKFDIESRTCVHDGLGNKPHCRYDPADCKDGVVSPVPGNCRHFKTCKNKSWQESSCLWPMKFDSVQLKCVWSGAQCA